MASCRDLIKISGIFHAGILTSVRHELILNTSHLISDLLHHYWIATVSHWQWSSIPGVLFPRGQNWVSKAKVQKQTFSLSLSSYYLDFVSLGTFTSKGTFKFHLHTRSSPKGPEVTHISFLQHGCKTVNGQMDGMNDPQQWTIPSEMINLRRSRLDKQLEAN